MHIFCLMFDTYVEPGAFIIVDLCKVIWKPYFGYVTMIFLIICRTKLCQTVLERHQGFAIWSKFGNGRRKCWSTWFKNWWPSPVFESSNEKWPRCNILAHYCTLTYSWHQKTKPRIHQITNLKCRLKAREPFKPLFLMENYFLFI